MAGDTAGDTATDTAADPAGGTAGIAGGLDRWLLGGALALQSALHLPALGLLPAWTDENWTLQRVTYPIRELWLETQSDVHPPLYYLLQHLWTRLLPLDTLTAMRMLSVLFGLAATAALDRLWLRELPLRQRMLALGLWVSSPALLLYARMARSYTLQLLIAVLLLGLLRLPRAERRLLPVLLLLFLAFFTDHVLGVGLALAALTALREPLRSRPGAWIGLILGCGLIPLLDGGTLLGSVARWGERAAGTLGPIQIALSAAFTGASLTFGETLPGLGWIGAVILTPALLWGLARGLPRLPLLSPILLLAAVGGLGVSGWVSFSFVPARVLYLAPFLLLAIVEGLWDRRIGSLQAGVIALLLWGLCRASAIPSYFLQRDFINTGYVLPFSVIASDILTEVTSIRSSSLVLLDSFNTDATGIVGALPQAEMRMMIVSGDDIFGRVEAELTADPNIRRVLLVRNTHDTSPDFLNERLEAWLAERMTEKEPKYWLSYGWLHRAGIGLLGWGYVPTHYLQMRKFER